MLVPNGTVGAPAAIEAGGPPVRPGGAALDIRLTGAVCDGTTDDSAAIAAAAALGAVLFPAGEIRIGKDLTIAVPVVAASGAHIRLAAGVTLKLEAGFVAGRHAVFEPEARVSFAAAHLAAGLPEWWGARPNDGLYDCRPALAAALRACRVVELASADYFMANTLVIDTPHRRLRGAGKLWEGPGTATRLIVRSATADCVRVGPDSNPGGGPNTFLQDVVLQGFAAWRDAAPAAPRSGYGGPTGVKLQYCVNCLVEDVASEEHSTGFSLTGCVYCKLRDCRAFRSASGGDAANDFFVGLLLDESAPIQLASGDASIYVEDCAIFVGGQPRLTRAIGVYCPGGFTDLFFSRLETGFLDRAMDLRADPKNNMSTQDLQVVNCIFDSCAQDGIYLEGDPLGADYRSNINILGCYIAGRTPAFQAAVHLRELTGCVSLTNNQLLGDDGANSGGLVLDGVNGVVSQGNMISDCVRPITLTRAVNCKLSDVINTSRKAGDHAAITLEGARRSVIDCVVRGEAATFTAGIRLVGVDNHHNELRCTGIDPDCIRAGAGKLVTGGSVVSVAGPFAGENVATGVMT